jgi:hypothetical protein
MQGWPWIPPSATSGSHFCHCGGKKLLTATWARYEAVVAAEAEGGSLEAAAATFDGYLPE